MKYLFHLFIFCTTLFLLTFSAQAQIKIGKKKPDTPKKKAREIADTLLSISDDYTPTLELNPYAQEIVKKEKKKKRKKKVFYGEKTKVRYTKDVVRNTIIIEKLHVPKVPKAPSPYLYEVYYFNEKKRAIEKTINYEPSLGPLLHGLYRRLANGQVVEQGLFFHGGKDGRWERFGADNLIVGKEYFYHGYPKHSKISYYDQDQKKIKEVVPIQYGKKDGMYLRYYENGRLAEVGEYVDDIKVGRWQEFYDKPKPNTKRETMHGNANKPYEPFEVKVVREWDEKGKRVGEN